MLTATSSPVLGGHLWHVVGLAAWAPIFGGYVGLERLRKRRDVRAASPSALPRASVVGWPLQAMAVACICAALVHLAVMPDHFRESDWYGGFFLFAAVSQVGLAATLLTRPTRPLVVAGIAGSGLVVALWLVSRLLGVPIGPDNGGTEPFGVLDTLASIAEVATMVAGMVSLRLSDPAPRWRLKHWALGTRCLAVACLTGTLVATVVTSRS